MAQAGLGDLASNRPAGHDMIDTGDNATISAKYFLIVFCLLMVGYCLHDGKVCPLQITIR